MKNFGFRKKNFQFQILLASFATLISLTLFATTINAAVDPGPVDPGGGSGIGTIIPPAGTVPTTAGDPSGLVARIVKSILTLLIIVAFIIAVIWNILAGLKFITASGDPKGISEAWSRIYWGLIGLVVVVGSFAIIKMVEQFFNIDIISGGLKLPTI